MKKRILSLVILVVLVFSLVPLVGAQDSGCFQLSPDDCALLNAAAANTETITSFSHRVVVDFTLTGLGDLDVSDITLSATGGGALVIVPGADIPLLMRVNLDANVLEGTEVIFSGPVVLALTEDYLYLPLDDELVGVPLTESLRQELDLGELTGGFGPSLDPDDRPITNLGDLLNLGADDMMMGETDELAARFITLNRLNDAQIMGETMYPFRFTFDVGGFLNSEEFMEAIGMLSALGMGDQQDLQEMMMILPMFLQDAESELAFTRYVSAGDNYIRKLTLEFGFSINLGMLFGDPNMDPVVANLLFDIELDDVNQVTTIAAPEGARLLTEEEARELLDQ